MNPQTRGPHNPGIRKAAILVASLDQVTADAILEQLGPEQAGRVRKAMVDLDRVDPQEQRRVIDEFFRFGSMMPDEHPPGIELDDRLAHKLSLPQTPCFNDEASAAALPDGPPFGFLHETEGEKVARALADERPQTIALVLSHLPPDRAASVLAGLQPALQVDVIRRLVELKETDPGILREVEQALESRLSQQVRMQRRRVAGMQVISGILNASEGPVAVQILDNLAAHDRSLAERLGPRRLQFDDLTQLSDAALSSVFEAAEPQLVMTALVGARPELVDRALRGLSPQEAANVRSRLDHPGPIRLSDLEGARQQLADLARRLAIEGHIQLPHEEPIPV